MKNLDKLTHKEQQKILREILGYRMKQVATLTNGIHWKIVKPDGSTYDEMHDLSTLRGIFLEYNRKNRQEEYDDFRRRIFNVLSDEKLSKSQQEPYRPRVYIAGKVTGLPYEEVQNNFHTIHNQLLKLSFKPVNPLVVVNDPKCEWTIAMRKCIEALMTCDAVFVQENYKDSQGAMLELEICSKLKIPFFFDLKDLVLHDFVVTP